MKKTALCLQGDSFIRGWWVLVRLFGWVKTSFCLKVFWSQRPRAPGREDSWRSSDDLPQAVKWYFQNGWLQKEDTAEISRRGTDFSFSVWVLQTCSKWCSCCSFKNHLLYLSYFTGFCSQHLRTRLCGLYVCDFFQLLLSVVYLRLRYPFFQRVPLLLCRRHHWKDHGRSGSQRSEGSKACTSTSNPYQDSPTGGFWWQEVSKNHLLESKNSLFKSPGT